MNSLVTVCIATNPVFHKAILKTLTETEMLTSGLITMIGQKLKQK